jgi:phosphohistidine phosphatase
LLTYSIELELDSVDSESEFEFDWEREKTPAMRLYFLRHATAEDHRPGLADLDRRLTDEGKAEMRAVARTMERLGLKVDRILTSPARRARETAVLAARALGGDQLVVEEPRLSPGCSFEALQSLLADHGAAQRLMVVGHEPDFSALISMLSGARNVEMKKAGLARLELTRVEPGAATLEWLIPPRVFEAGDR